MTSKPFADGVPAQPEKKRFGMIVKADHTGDTTVATFEPGVENDASVAAQAKLTSFLQDCLDRTNYHPPVFAKRIGEKAYTPFKSGTDNIVDVETILIQQPLVGG